ncbi:MAG: helix-turn-helix transcriptional regulator [Clostridia bacterium]|nr:helix-turn-helix transcriptional regulator [Clostridia bacterium]
MFFGQDEISVNITNVLKLDWEKRNDRAANRPFHALSFRIKGNAEMIVSNRKQVHLETSDIAFVPANLIYTQIAKEEELYVIHFTCSELLPYQIKKITPQNPEYFEHLFSKIYAVWAKKHPGYVLECKSIIYKIMLKIEQEYNTQKMIPVNNKILDAVEYIHDNFTDHDLSVELLAKQFGMSSTYFRNQFASVFHVTPLKYINQLRFTYAQELLESDYYTIEDIAEKCGFNNINYFSLFIKKQTGVSPTVLRKQLKNQNLNLPK